MAKRPAGPAAIRLQDIHAVIPLATWASLDQPCRDDILRAAKENLWEPMTCVRLGIVYFVDKEDS